MDFNKLLEDDGKLKASPEIKQYHHNLKLKVKEILELATKAREMGIDPTKEVEIYIAQDVASRTEGLVGPKGVAKRLKELEKTMSKAKIVIQIAKEIAQGKFFQSTPEQLADQALRTAISYQTEGITAAPIEGISKVLIKTNQDGTSYLAVYYAGPIRSAGGTAQGVSTLIADVIRKELKLDRYKATEKEVERMLEEVRLYNKIMHLQLPTSDEEIRYAWRNIPIQITGDPTEKEEVGGYRDIPSMDSNRVRGGACLVLNDGLVGRAKKIMKRVKKMNIEGWEWLADIAAGKYSDKRATESQSGGKPTKVTPDYSFAEDALMGRPTFADPTAVGGFRLRYGHARNTGIAGIGIHPGLMAAVQDFLAPGTHVRTERPGKGSIVAPIDTIRPPIVRLKNGNVIKVNSYELGQKIVNQIDEILFVGDMLVGVGEFFQNNYRLTPPGYNVEWWALEMLDAGWPGKKEDEHDIEFFARINYNHPDVHTAIEMAKKYNVALHPCYTPMWKYAQLKELPLLHKCLWETDNTVLSKECKKILEDILVPHTVLSNGLDIGDMIEALKIQLPKNADLNQLIEKEEDALKVVQQVSIVNIKDTVGTTIGARMGRPEKAKARLMKPQLHGLFPLGKDKDIKRTLSKAIDKKFIKVSLGNRYCKSCNKSTWMLKCPECNKETILRGTCTRCGAEMKEGPCDECGGKVSFTRYFNINIRDIMSNIYKHLIHIPNDVKLKDVLKNPEGMPEIIDKGILRAQYGLNVFRDGTIRYDATDAPLTHFMPKEIDVSVKRLREIGYTHDMFGKPLERDDQLLEIKPQDIIVHKSIYNHLYNVSKFVDDELQKIYGLDPYYNIKSHEDLIGHLIIGLAPHTSAGVIGRLIGYTRSSVCWAHPFWHSSKRRNCDGDEDGIILLLDGFLNFSKKYLPTTRGSKMDTPLVLVVTLNPGEVDDEAYNLDCMTNYTLDFYRAACDFEIPSKLSDLIQRAEQRIGKAEQFEGFVFSHFTSDMAQGPLKTKYKDSNLNIRDKLNVQLGLAKKIRAVNEKENALRILEKHTLPDLMGNLRAFASQKIRCVTCNTKYRRIPISGKCRNPECPKSNLVLTVPPKGVTKYFDICEMLVKNYNLGKYHEDRLERIKISLEGHFSEKKKAVSLDLSEWL